MFQVLSDIHLDSGSVRIIPQNKTHSVLTSDSDSVRIIPQNKTHLVFTSDSDRFGSVRIHFYRIGFGSGSVYLPSPSLDVGGPGYYG